MVLTSVVGLSDAIQTVTTVVTDFLPICMKEPVIYFVAGGLLAMAAAIVTKFVPIGRSRRK